MRKFQLSLLAIAAAAAGLFSGCQQGLTRYVNPMVGTDFHGHTFPAAIVPFGQIQPGPDTRLEGWDGCSGYHYSDDTIYGFSHTHLNGTGCEDYCDILLMPVLADSMHTERGTISRQQYQSHFSHRSESAHPGYYRVVLDRYRIMAEMTATERVAAHRYTFSSHEEKAIVIDLQHRDKVIDAGFENVSASSKRGGQVIAGWRRSHSWSPDQSCYFALECSVPFTKVEYFDNNTKALLHLPARTKEVEVYVAISGVDCQGALKNLNTRRRTDDFDDIRRDADSLWEAALGKVEVSGGSRTEKRNFYTALYHCYTSPYLWSDIDGRYRGMDGAIHKAERRPGSDQLRNVYTVFSLWDTYRTLHPLMTLIEPQRTSDFVYTMLKQWQQGGELTMWELSAHETHCMIGYHSAPTILEAYVHSDLCRQDTAFMLPLLRGMVATSSRDETLQHYANDGYLSSEYDNESVSKTIEYSYDDWCIAQFAQLTRSQLAGRWASLSDSLFCDSIYNVYMRRCQSWQNIMDSRGFMHARRNGGFVTPFDPTEVNNHYTEANSWQYSSYVPHDVPQWVRMMGGEAKAALFLDSLFNSSSQTTGRDQSDITGMIGQYAHGNEPSHHAAYLYAYLGQADKTDHLVHKILHELYTPRPDGLCGNEDCGQMSAWYVMSAMGLYPVCPGSGEYVTVTPLFSRVVVHRDGQADLVIDRKDWPAGKFLRDGKFYDASISGIPQEMRRTPAPCFDDWQQRFEGSRTIRLTSRDSSAAIFYTTDGSRPDTSSARYTRPIYVGQDMTLRAVAYTPQGGYSPIVSQRLTQFIADKRLTYVTKPEPQYIENGEEGLIDRLHGTPNYRIGGWQGWSQDMEVVVDLLDLREVRHVGVECLENMRSWIFFPSSVEVSVSADGQSYTPYGPGKVGNDIFAAVRERQEESVMHEFAIESHAVARYLKIKAVNYGALPDWHVSAGQQAWLFVDEIEIR